MKVLAAAAAVLMLAGCATAPRPQVHVVPRAVVAQSTPVVEPAKPTTFKDRFRKFRGKLRWVH